MWYINSILCFFLWALADLFYKKAANPKDNYSELKTAIIVGLVMGLNAFVFILFNKTSINIIEMLKYLPVSFCYIFSMYIGYKGLKYLTVSIISPIQNASGVITAILLAIVFKQIPLVYQIFAIILIAIGVIGLGFIENKQDKPKKKITNMLPYICYPLIYCFFDGLGTFLDAIYLDELGLITEDNALIAYEMTFFIFSCCSIIYLKLKNEKLILIKQKDSIIAATFETLGQFFYVYAMAQNAQFAAPVVASYCVGSVILGRLFLKEKLSKLEYFFIVFVLIGIIILGFE